MSIKFRFLIDPLQGLARGFFRSFGYEILKVANVPQDELNIIKQVKLFTCTSQERISGLIDAVKYVSQNQIEGDFVECGVWRGGSMMAAMLMLKQLGDTSRNFYLFDTYEGMTPPTDKDVMYDGTKAVDVLAGSEKKEGPTYWCIASLDDVKQNVYSTGYPKEKIHFVKGRVEDTVPKLAPQKISLLRLDTDWYESTKHEMVFLYPRLVSKGILIIDDYGHWQGSRTAVEEYFSGQAFQPFLNKLDFTGRLVVKPVV
jgi:hypothetical protein